MDVGHERKRGAKHNSKVFGLGNWMNGIVIYRAGKTMKGAGVGRKIRSLFFIILILRCLLDISEEKSLIGN